MDKYAPRRFQDLMSDERINGDVATWLAAGSFRQMLSSDKKGYAVLRPYEIMHCRAVGGQVRPPALPRPHE